MKIIGNILTVLEGRVEDNLFSLDASVFQFALGSGTFSDSPCVGETIVINSKATISWVEEGELKTKSGNHFSTPFLIGIEKEAHFEKRELQVNSTIQEFYIKLLEEFSKGFAIVGDAKMQILETTFLKCAPIFHENINLHSEKYWSPPSSDENQEVIFFGVIMPLNAHEIYSEATLSKAFYRNPKDQASHLISHTHAALMEKKEVVGARHLLTPSVVKEGIFKIYPIKGIDVA